MLHTTFKLAHKHNGCANGYAAVATALGGVKEYGFATPISLARVMDICGFDAALNYLVCVLPDEEERRDRDVRLLLCDYADHVAHLWQSPAGVAWTPASAISVARRYALGQATKEALGLAEFSAWGAKESYVFSGGLGTMAGAAAASVARAVALSAASTSSIEAATAARSARWFGVYAATDNDRLADAARDAEGAWQAERFREMLEKEL